MKKCLVTGGCGFIGSNYIRTVLDREEDLHVVNLDKLTYAGNIQNLDGISSNNLTIVKGDICDVDLVNSIFEKHHFDTVVHFAAESHVDRSIEGPAEFIQTNVVGTLNLLEQSRFFYNKTNNDNFRFLHVSTDEVYGDIKMGIRSSEKFSYNPSSPYSASKACIIGFSKSVALELGSRNIRSNVIAPGFIETDMTDSLSEDVINSWKESIPLKRGGDPSDVGNACVFLASDSVSYTHLTLPTTPYV